MTPAELREQLEKGGLSQRGAARELGLDERTMRKYCAGNLPVPKVVELALRWVAQQSLADGRS
jgi:hypothetical protein